MVYKIFIFIYLYTHVQNICSETISLSRRIVKDICLRLSGLTDMLMGRSSCTPAISYPAMAAKCIICEIILRQSFSLSVTR